jgi:N-acyl homoserine lactone hydrolase
MAIKSLQVLFLGVASTMNKGMMTFMKDLGQEIEIPNLSYLVRADEGNILIDAGFHPDDVAVIAKNNKMDVPAELYLPQQLKKIGLSPDDINMVVLTHLNIDHIGWLRSFLQAEVFVQQEEYRYTMFPHTVYPPPFTEKDRFPERFDFSRIKWHLVDGDQELFPGLSVIFTPGHTAGHQSVMVDLPESGPIIIAGDAAFLQENLDKEIVPLYWFDARQTWLSLKRIKLWAQVRHARIFPGHDFEYWQKQMKKSPEAYT